MARHSSRRVSKNTGRRRMPKTKVRRRSSKTPKVRRTRMRRWGKILGGAALGGGVGYLAGGKRGAIGGGLIGGGVGSLLG